MRWFDAGVNLMDPRFDKKAVLAESFEHNVTDLLIIASDLDESFAAVKFAKQNNNPDVNLHLTAGVHPHKADHTSQDTWTQLRGLLADKAVCAVGECGLDFNRNFSTPENQIRTFDAQLQLALECQKGVYLHERDAFEQQCKMLKPVFQKLPFLVAHCFTGSTEQMKAYLDMGCYIGITGWICDDKRGYALQESVKQLPMNRLLLETDAPYLFPKNVKPRAKQNTPKYISAIAQKVADIKQVSLQEVAEAAFENARNLFKS
ncbi:TatD family hydrolase [Glaciecola sp. SC05]|uniref:TatD family hydrolase n=1 Tax=Glaciecola sp. SC05 TaxID=1987355 RepID=UPI0035291AF7